MKIKENTFRTDFNNLFEKSDALTASKFKHTPFIVLDEKDGVTICDNAHEVANSGYSNKTNVLKQWAGQWSSDFIIMTVGDIKKGLAEKTKNLTE